ncbi:MAG: hypothetical protein IKR57_00305 [Bacilli bacterium]|nr:hypothetical protein [Bacilli bacterium]
MAKKGMQLKYKTKKRERNKVNEEVTTTDSIKSFGKTLIGVVIFLGLMYLMGIGFQKLGAFDIGYTAPTKDATEISYEFIPASTVFNRSDSVYYVLFDNYKNSFSNYNYIEKLIEKETKTAVYKVDMSKKDNAKVIGEKANPKATKYSELSIDDVTLIKITKGKITLYLSGSEKIEEYLSK